MGMEELTFEAYKRSYWATSLSLRSDLRQRLAPYANIYDTIGSGNGRLHGA